MKKPTAMKGGEPRKSSKAKAGAGEEDAETETASGPMGRNEQTLPNQE